MVRKMTVRFQELACGNIRSQRLQDLLRVKSACAVSGVHDDLQSRKRFVRRFGMLHFRDDLFPEMRGISCDQVFFMYGAVIGFGCKMILEIFTLRAVDDMADIFFVQSAVAVKILETVAVERQVAGGDHDRPIAPIILKDRRHEHSRGRGQTAVINRRSHLLQRGEDRLLQTFRTEPAVMPYRDREILRALLQFFTEPEHKALSQTHRLFRSEIDRFPGDALHGNPADITSVL